MFFSTYKLLHDGQQQSNDSTHYSSGPRFGPLLDRDAHLSVALLAVLPGLLLVPSSSTSRSRGGLRDLLFAQTSHQNSMSQIFLCTCFWNSSPCFSLRVRTLGRHRGHLPRLHLHQGQFGIALVSTNQTAQFELRFWHVCASAPKAVAPLVQHSRVRRETHHLWLPHGMQSFL